MNRTERIPLLCGYLAATLAMLGALAVAVVGATTAPVCLFVAGIVGVAVSTAAIIDAEQQHPNGGRP